MKKLYAVGILALMLLMVGNVFAQVTTQTNTAWKVYEKTGYLATTANDTTKVLSLVTMANGRRSAPFDISFFGRSNDSIRVIPYYRLKNIDANWTGAWTKLDSIIHVDNASAILDTTSDGVNHNVLASTTVKGADAIQLYFDYAGGDAGVKNPSTAAGDGTNTRFRYYMVVRTFDSK